MIRGRGGRSLGGDVERIGAAVGSVAFDGAYDGFLSGAHRHLGPENGAPMSMEGGEGGVTSWTSEVVGHKPGVGGPLPTTLS